MVMRSAPVLQPTDAAEIVDRGERPRGSPYDAGEVFACTCGRPLNAAVGATAWLLDCDVCHHWFHGPCVGLGEHEAAATSAFVCESCALRQQLLNQQVRRAGA